MQNEPFNKNNEISWMQKLRAREVLTNSGGGAWLAL